MKPFFSLSSAAVVACALVASSPVSARDTKAQSVARRALIAQYQKVDQANLRQDIPTLMSLMAPDFMLHDQTYGSLDRAQTENMMRQSLASILPGVTVRYSRVQTKFLSLTWRGPDAIIVAHTTAAATGSGYGRTVRIESVGVSRDYWSPTPSGWRIRQSVERESKIWRDGKRIR